MRLFYLLLLLAILGGCGSSPEVAPVLGQAYVGALKLQVRKELAARADLVATLKHGERVDLIGRRRRFMRIRTATGVEGWVDSRQLLSREDMEDLRRLAERAAKAPSQGEATVFDSLNVHSAPNRQSPSFFQVTKEMRVDTIAHMRAPRVSFTPPELLPDAPARRTPAKKKKKEASIPPPPKGPPPAVPADWLALSGRRDLVGLEAEDALEQLQQERNAGLPPEQTQVPSDDWTLVREKGGRAGWVLTRPLFMAIPDEVAQYAERARISAYFALDTAKPDTRADAAVKHDWLWATLAQRGVDHDFDSIRVFIWNNRRKRYETSYIERNLKGWTPIEVRRGAGGRAESFSLVVEEKDGRIAKRTYSINGNRLRFQGRQPGERPPGWYVESRIPETKAPPPPPEKRWKEKVQDFIGNLKQRFRR
jgi:SH3-like domain-containing protein